MFVLGAGLVTEALVLMNWCERLGFGPFVLTGLSMGGHMACLASTVWPKALALVPCISWTTASTVFTRVLIKKYFMTLFLAERTVAGFHANSVPIFFRFLDQIFFKP